MIKTAIVAYGFSANTFHVPFLSADNRFQITSFVSRRSENVLLDHPDVCVVPELKDLDFSSIDLVVITSPNIAHFEQAKFALEHGAHVVIEKPMVTNSAQAIDLANIAAANKRQLIVFQNRRWDGDFLTIQSLIENGQLGKVKKLYSRWDRFRPVVRERWREQAIDGSGILWDLGPHLIDQAVALFGSPKTVQASVSATRENSVVDDNFEIILEFEEVTVHVGSSCYNAGPNQRFRIEGTKGSFLKYGLDVQEDSLKKGLDVTDDRWGHEPSENWGVLYQNEKSQVIASKPGDYGVFWYQVAQCIEAGAETPVPISEALTVVKIIEQAHISAKTGRKVSL